MESNDISFVCKLEAEKANFFCFIRVEFCDRDGQKVKIPNFSRLRQLSAPQVNVFKFRQKNQPKCLSVSSKITNVAGAFGARIKYFLIDLCKGGENSESERHAGCCFVC